MVGTRRAVVVVLVSAILVVSVWVAAPSHSSFVAGGGPSLNNGAVGQSVPGALVLVNLSSPPDDFPAAAAAIDFYPACTTGANDCAGGTAEPDVYVITVVGNGSSTPPGVAGCEGTWTSTEASPGRWRFVPPGGEGTLTLEVGASCSVSFTGLILRVPAVDVSGQPGAQTAPVLTATFTSAGPAFAVRNGGSTVVTVSRGGPTISTTATPIVPIGSPIQDSASVSGATPAPVAQPTGTVTFRAYGPDDQFCELPAAFTSAPRALGGGLPRTANSGSFTATSPGTYHWVADYSGDANYIPAAGSCGEPDETSLVTQSFATSATPSVTIGNPIQDVATVAAHPAPAPGPTGTLTFKLFGPDDATCAGPPIFTNTTPLGGGPPPTASSGSFTPTSPGTYRWIASYSGDANYTAGVGECNEPNETSVVHRASPSMVTSATPSVNLGGTIGDVATVSGAPAPTQAPTGTVTFRLFGPDNPTCSNSPIFVSAPATLTGGPPRSANSGPFTPTSPGNFRWIAVYGGDVNYDPVSGTCGDLNEVSVVTAPASGRYTPLSPVRILDTRNGTGGIPGPVGSGATVDMQITGRGGVPASGVSAVALNVTVTQPTATGFLTMFPAGSSRPLAANLNFTPNKTVANLVVVKLGAGGAVSMFNSAGSTHVIYDVAGWYSDNPAGNDGRYVPVTPTRLLDTRGGVRLGPGASLDLQVSGAGGVPATGASAAVLNVTVTGPTATSFLTVYPTGTARPLAANVNFTSGSTLGNRAFAKLGAGGKVTIYNNAGSTDVIVDVSGWFTDSSVARTTGVYNPLTPARILDTRNGIGGISGPRPANSTVDVQVTGQGGVPATGVTAVTFNATVVSPGAPGFLTIFAAGTARPLASDLNHASGETRPNLVVAKVGAGGKVSLYTSAGGHYVFDVAGWIS